VEDLRARLRNFTVDVPPKGEEMGRHTPLQAAPEPAEEVTGVSFETWLPNAVETWLKRTVQGKASLPAEVIIEQSFRMIYAIDHD
jgi:hypothetical protein